MKNIQYCPKFIVLTLLFLFYTSNVMAFFGSSCFLPGTLITLGNGSQIPIENVKVGDKIISFDDKLNKVISEVLETEAPIRDDYYVMNFENGKILNVTNDHPLYIKSVKYEGWGSIIPEASLHEYGIKTKKIQVGDYILNIEKKWIRIVNIKHINEKVQTYNLKKVDKTNTFFAEGFLAHNKGNPPPPPPPPPPPCPWEAPGCFKVGGKKVPPRETTPSEFDYYLPENTRCDSSGGGCACYSKPSNPGSPPLQKNPDDSSAACTCIDVSDWSTKSQCCGDDADDCGKVKNGLLCSQDVNRESANWISSTANLGDIRYVGCARKEFLSDGNDWQQCNGTFWRRTIGSGEYICIGNGRESIVECCGDGNCNSRIDGKRISTGQSVNPSKFENEIAPNKTTSGISTQLSTKQDCQQIQKTGCQNIENCDGENFTFSQCTSRIIQGPLVDCRPAGPHGGGGCLPGIPITVYDCTKQVCTTITGNVIKSSSNQITGDIVSGTENSKTYYCTPSRKFTTDLDANQPGISSSDRKAACEKAGFTWTGTKCCSEDDDPEEFYNDPNGKGGCWNKKYIMSISFVPATNNSVINYNGEFHGCAIDKTNFNADNDDLLIIYDTHTLNQLIANHDYCFNNPAKNYYCSYTEKWIPTNGADRTHLTSAPIDNPLLAAECCAQTECWNGAQCVSNQKSNPKAQPIGNGFRCIDGQWEQSGLKTTPDGISSGFCPDQTQCLANAEARNLSSQCINSTQYIDDNYCESGNWSSRTKLLALKILKTASGDYTLFCDTRENTLNNLQYLTSSNELVANVLQNMQTNNFCVMKTGNRIIAATSINKNLEDLPRSNLNLLGITSCNIIDDGQYHTCDSSNKAWYNKKLKSFIYSKDPIQILSEEQPASFIGSIINGIIDAIKGLVSSQQLAEPIDDSYLRGIKKFDKLYIAQQGILSIKGSIEGTGFKNVIVQYAGFETDLCRFVEQFNAAKPGSDAFGISCKKSGNAYYVLAQGDPYARTNIDTIWTDLTSKLRLGIGLAQASGGSCSDGIKNQNEIGVDCGGACNSCASDKNICQNAQDGELCSGLEIAYNSEYRNSCCREFRLCC